MQRSVVVSDGPIKEVEMRFRRSRRGGRMAGRRRSYAGGRSRRKMSRRRRSVRPMRIGYRM